MATTDIMAIMGITAIMAIIAGTTAAFLATCSTSESPSCRTRKIAQARTKLAAAIGLEPMTR